MQFTELSPESRCTVTIVVFVEIKDSKKNVIGMTILAQVIKNRLGPPLRKAEFPLYFESGVDDEGRALLNENSAAGLTIGILNATDPNPDDEFTYAISSQTMDGTSINYFILLIHGKTS